MKCDRTLRRAGRGAGGGRAKACFFSGRGQDEVMKRLLGAVCGFGGLAAAEAHESWAPHTHVLEQRHSDLFILAVSGLILLVAGLAWARWACHVEQRRRTSVAKARRSADSK